ncbi:MAG: hypothetical protein RL346_2116 [Verrucomicrobiota bacterium]|jgi:hypothetical protein
MLDTLQRNLEIGNHGERLRAVRELAGMGSREACELLNIAAGDIDPQIRDEARRAIQANVYHNGPVTRDGESDGANADDVASLF